LWSDRKKNKAVKILINMIYGNQPKIEYLVKMVRGNPGISTVKLKPADRLTPHQVEILRQVIGENDLTALGRDERVGAKSSFDVVFRPGEQRLLPLFPVVIKVPQPRTTRGALEFTKQNLGGIVAPFIILEDALIHGIRHSFVIVQLYQAVCLKGPLSNTCQMTGTTGIENKARELILKMIERGIMFYDGLIAKHFGVDIATGRLYLIGGMHLFTFATRDEAFEEATDEMSEGMVRSRKAGTRFFTKNWGDRCFFDRIGLPPDEELFELWGTKREEREPVPDIMLYIK